MASPNLDAIPLEILVQITSYLSTPDYGALRLTSRFCEASLFPFFARQFFSRMQFMRTEFSLQALVDISQSRLSSYLRHVDIGVETLHSDYLQDTMAGARTINRQRPANPNDNLEEKVRYNRFEEMCIDQQVFIDLGQDQQMLTEAFRNLQLDTVGLQSRKLYPHDAGEGSLSCGAAKILKETSIDLRTAREVLTYGNDVSNASCFRSLLYALAKSGSRPKRIETGLRKCLLPDAAFNIPRFMQQAALPILSDLQTLSIGVGGELTENMRLIAPKGQAPYLARTYHLRKFLGSLTQLRHLHLSYSSHFDGFFEWLAAPVPSEDYNGPPELEPPKSPALTGLRELGFTCSPIAVQHLLAIIGKCSATLQKLRLHVVSLYVDEKKAPSHHSITYMWGDFFTTLSQIAGNLEDIHFSELNRRARGDPRAIAFETRDNRFVQEFSYMGPDIRSELESLPKKISISVDRTGKLDHMTDAPSMTAINQ
ncbi:hypothetical protein F5B20DRAFT_558742 [Whalleya microplaca]|nr:hypothetical protein F5B20DRAFT_558742 [Whalleya microplaca]